MSRTTGQDAAVIDTARLTYTVDEVAYLLNLSRGIAYQYVRDGVIPAERIGRRWLIRASASTRGSTGRRPDARHPQDSGGQPAGGVA